MNDDELIERWKKKQDMLAYKQLKNRHKNMVYKSVHRYKASGVPQPSLEAKAWELFDDAVKNYDPEQGAKFSTYLNYNLRKIDRHTKKHQNVARIPEALASKIGDYQRAKKTLGQSLSRQPTYKELANALDMPIGHVKQLHRSQRADLYEGKFEEGQEVQQQRLHTDWLLKELREELTPSEKRVYDHLIGHKKRKITNKKKLAKKLGMSPGRLSQITGSIARKIGPQIKKRL